MISFHNDTKIKKKYVDRVKMHRLADNLIRGTGWANGKGCAVGCTLEKYDHKAYETELGIPEWLAKLEDRLFEGMSETKSRTWPEYFLKAIPVGVDLEPIKKKFLVIVLDSALTSFDHKKYPNVKKAIITVRKLLKKKNATKEEFRAARAYAAYAADAACAAYAADAARQRKYDYFADKLLKLLKAAK